MFWRKCISKQSRREFLATTLAPGIGYACLPSLATVIGNANAIASGCASESAGTEFPAFIALDLAGGASIAGNNVIVFQGDGKELLTSYEGLGLPSALHPKDKINEELGLKMHTDSRMLAGIKAVVSEGTLGNVNGCVICTQTADDTGANELASAPGIFAAGGAGSIVPLVATQGGGAGSSGGQSANAFTTSVAPTLITSPASAGQIVSPGNYWSDNQARARLERVLRKIQNMSSAQLKRFAELTTSEQALAMADCGYQDAVRLMSPEDGGGGADTFNPFSNEFRGQEGTLQGQDPAVPAIGYLVLKGFAGAGTITLTGYDYHDGTITTGEQRDERAGRAIGTLLEMAKVLNRKLMIHVYTDGGVGIGSTTDGVPGADGSDVEKFVWRTDTETHSAAFVLIYDPAGKPDIQTQQLGAYRDAGRQNGVVNLNPAKHGKIANSAHGQASVVVGNWLAWQTGDYATKFTAVNTQLRSGAVINNQELDDYLFVPKASG